MRFLESMATTKLDKSAKCVSGRTVAYRTEINSDVNESKKFVSEKRNVRRHKIDPLENIDLKMQNILKHRKENDFRLQMQKLFSESNQRAYIFEIQKIINEIKYKENKNSIIRILLILNVLFYIFFNNINQFLDIR